MSKTIKLALTAPTDGLIHQFRNFGEDIWRDLKEECSVSLEEIDASTSFFFLPDLKKNSVRSVAAKARRIAAKHQMGSLIDVTEVES